VGQKRELALGQAPRLLEPGPLVLITSLYRAQHNVMTAGWLLPLGFQPVRVAVAIHPSRLTHEFITRGETFALNVPTLELLNAVHRCGIESGRDGDKFVAAGLTPIDAVAIEPPLVNECVAHIECGLIERLTLADHDLFVGEVLTVTADDAAFGDRWLIGEGVELIHHLAADQYIGPGKVYRGWAATEVEES